MKSATKGTDIFFKEIIILVLFLFFEVAHLSKGQIQPLAEGLLKATW